MAYVLVVDNKGVEVARFHHEELRASGDLHKLMEAVQAAQARDLQHYDPSLSDVAL